jgi:tetratricopeptide (TPR) repeat protein
MQTKPFNSAILLAAILISTYACSPTREATSDSGAGTPQRQISLIEYSPEELQVARNQYIQGVTAFEMQDFNQALDLLTMAYIKLPEHAGVNFALADAYMFTGDFTNAAYYASQAIDIEPENKWYHVKLVEIHIRNNDARSAIEILQRAEVRFPSDVDLLVMQASLLTEEGRYAESNRAYDRVLKVSGPDPQVFFQKFRNFSLSEQPDSARVQMEKLYQIDPSNPGVLQTLGGLYIEANRPSDAIELYEKALSINPDQPQLRIGLADMLIQQNLWDRAGDILFDLMNDPLVEADIKTEMVQFIMARFVRDPENPELRETASRIVELFATLYPNRPDAQAIAADFFLSTDDSARAADKLRETVRLLPDNENAWRQLVQLYYSEGNYAQIIAMSDEIEIRVPEDAFMRFFVGLAYSFSDDKPNAVKWLTLATEVPARSALKSIIYGSLADTYQSMDQWDNAVRAYEESIRLDPLNATALNNYAYYLSVRNERLEDAYEMSRISVEEEPANPSFLDTLGWIYFKKGNYDRARHYINASIEAGGSSATILEHMGDVYNKLGDLDQARVWWEKAYETDSQRTYLRERLERN